VRRIVTRCTFIKPSRVVQLHTLKENLDGTLGHLRDARRRHSGRAKPAQPSPAVAGYGGDGVTNPTTPKTYPQWRHCITVDCGIALTRIFAKRRLAASRAPAKEEARRFAQQHGEAYLQQGRAWFEHAHHTSEQKPTHE